MSHLSADTTARALNQRHVLPLADHRAARARNRLHGESAPTRVIEIGEVTAGIAVPETGGVRFFASNRDFIALDGTVYRSVEQAAKAARDRFRTVTRPASRGSSARETLALRAG